VGKATVDQKLSNHLVLLSYFNHVEIKFQGGEMTFQNHIGAFLRLSEGSKGGKRKCKSQDQRGNEKWCRQPRAMRGPFYSLI
jgi:hypothetical protein